MAMTRAEMAASSQLEMDEVEKAAVELLKGREAPRDAGSLPWDTSAASPAGSPGLRAAASQKSSPAAHP